MKTHILARSEVLYHATYLEYAESILDSGYFKLSAATDDNEARFGKNLYYLSMSRSINSDIVRQRNIVFEIDGRKLQKYKIVPINYFSGIKKSGEEIKSDEMEDRLLSTNPLLPISCVTAIHMLKPRFTENPRMAEWVQRVKRLAVKRRIPFYVYDTYFHKSRRQDYKLAPLPIEQVPLPGTIHKQSKSERKYKMQHIKLHTKNKRLVKLFTYVAIAPLEKLHITKDVSKLVTAMKDLEHFPWYSEQDLDPIVRFMRRNEWDRTTLRAYVVAKLQYIMKKSIPLLYVHKLLTDQKVSKASIGKIAELSAQAATAQLLLLKQAGYDSEYSFLQSKLLSYVAKAKKLAKQVMQKYED